MIRWLSAPIRTFFNVRFEAAHNEVRDVRILLGEISVGLLQVQESLAGVTAELSDLKGSIESDRAQISQVASIVGRDLTRLREQMEEASARRPSPVDAHIALALFVVRALAEVELGGRVLVVGADADAAAVALASLGFEVSRIGIDAPASGAPSAARAAHSAFDSAVSALTPSDPAALFDAVAVVGQFGAEPSGVLDVSSILPHARRLLRAKGVLALVLAAADGGESQGAAGTSEVTRQLAEWQDVSVTLHDLSPAAAMATSGALVTGDVLLARARKPEL